MPAIHHPTHRDPSVRNTSIPDAYTEASEFIKGRPEKAPHRPAPERAFASDEFPHDERLPQCE
ncbi:MAG TPA: hypothetical protein VFQ61_36590 [Polyangiaceae bacterium]|nr:hypothetical protein [Polyangiaceae bacterium]